MYGIKLDDVRAKMLTYRDKAAVGLFYKNYHHSFVTNLYSQAHQSPISLCAVCCRCHYGAIHLSAIAPYELSFIIASLQTEV